MRLHYFKSRLPSWLPSASIIGIILVAVFVTANQVQQRQDIRQQAATSPTDLLGGIDVATCEEIRGWACDKTNPNLDINVSIKFNDGFAFNTTANIARVPKSYNSPQIEDVLLSNAFCNRPSNNPSRRNIGWTFRIPPQFKDGNTYTISATTGTGEIEGGGISKQLTYFWDKVDYQNSNKKYTITCGPNSQQNTIRVTPCQLQPGQTSCMAQLQYNFENTNVAEICKTTGPISFNESAMSIVHEHILGSGTGGSGLINVPLNAGTVYNFYMLGAPAGGNETPPNPTIPDCSGALLAGVTDIGVIVPTSTPTPIPTSTPVPPTPTPIPPTPTPDIVCAQDLRQCSDGSFVGRVPPACQFAPCPPTPTPTPDNVCAQDLFTCPDGSRVGRVPPACQFAPCPNVSPTPVGLAGNIVPPNTSVDLFDYNAVVNDFGMKGSNLRSDIVKGGTSNNSVDILDYNQVVSNYGRTL